MQQMQLSGIDLNLLPVLQAVLQTRSIKAAAPRLGLSPSAVSHALSRLRELLDDQLLVRSGRAMQLTPRAERLRPQVQQLIDQVGQVLHDESEPLEPARLSRSFTIAGGDFAELTLLEPLGRRLARVAPGVDLHGLAIDGEVAAQVRSGRCDARVGVFGDPPDDVRTHDLLHSDFVCLLRAGHPALQRRLTLRRYAALDHVLVSPRGGSQGVVDGYLRAEGLSRRVTRTVSSFVAAPYFVAGSDCVLTISELIAERFAGPLGLVTRPPPLPLTGFTVRLAWHRRFDADPAHAWLRQQIIEQAAEVAPRRRSR